MKITLEKSKRLSAGKKLSLSLLLLFIVVSLSGAVILFTGDASGGHGGCPFMQHSQSMCQMGPMAHVEHWQQMFMALPAEFISLIVLAVALGFAVVFLGAAQIRSPRGTGIRLYIREFHAIKFYNYFVRLFSRGILHSRVYA